MSTGWMILFSLLTQELEAIERKNELFKAWQQAQHNVKSLVVRYTLESTHSVFEVTERYEIFLRLLRTEKGELFATLESADKTNNNQPSWLLNRGRLYFLNPERRSAIRLTKMRENDLWSHLVKSFNPFIILLDRKRAEELCQLQVVKQDKWYTYLDLIPKKADRASSLFALIHQARIVLMKKDTKAVPKNMPRQITYISGHEKICIDIKQWKLNGSDVPKQQEFIKPQDRPNWKVVDWPF